MACRPHPGLRPHWCTAANRWYGPPGHRPERLGHRESSDALSLSV